MVKRSGACNQRPQLTAVEAEGSPPSMKVDHSSGHPLHKYQYSQVTLESESPPTLVFTSKINDSATPTRYVKKGGKWEFDVGSFGLERGTFEDMVGGVHQHGDVEFVFPILPKRGGLAMRKIYHQLLNTKEPTPVEISDQHEALSGFNESETAQKLFSAYKRVTVLLPTGKDKLSIRAYPKDKTSQVKTDSISELVNSDLPCAQALTDSLHWLSDTCNEKKAGYKLTIASRKGKPVYELSMRLGVVAEIGQHKSEVGIFKRRDADLGKLLSRAQEKLDTPNHALIEEGKRIYPNPNFFNEDGTVLGGTPVVVAATPEYPFAVSSGGGSGTHIAVDFVKMNNMTKSRRASSFKPVPSPTHYEVNPETGQADLSQPISNQFWRPKKSKLDKLNEAALPNSLNPLPKQSE